MTAENQARFVRYQIEYFDRARTLSKGVPARQRLSIEARAANAARQLGRFAEAEAMRKTALATYAQAPDDQSWKSYLTALSTVIAREDATTEPLDMIPKDMVGLVCKDRAIKSDFDKATCPAT